MRQMQRVGAVRACRKSGFRQVAMPVGMDALEPRGYLTVSFGTPTAITGVDSPTAIAAGDFTGSGKTDIVVAATEFNVPALDVFLNTGSGYKTGTISAFTGTPGGVAVGKFSSTTHLGIAVVDSSTDTLDLFLGDGAGDFTPGVGASLGGSGDSVVASGDFLGNGSGNDGVAVVNNRANQVQIAIANGDANGTFTVESPLSVPSPVDVVVGDFNKDGKADIAALSSNGSIYVALSNGNGTFSTPVAHSAFSSGAKPIHLATADFNGDGLTDLVALGSASGTRTGTVSVLLNKGAGTFGAATTVATGLAATPESLVTGQFALTNHEDIGVINSTGGLTILPGNGDGTFGRADNVFTTQLGDVGPAAVAVDINNDGKPDIALAAGSKGAFTTVSNTGVAVQQVSGTVYDDVNGDGVKERKEPGLAGITVTLQKLKRGKASGAALTTTTNSSGLYLFNNLAVGTYEVTEILPRHRHLTQPSTISYILSVTTGADLINNNFGNFP